MSLSNMFTLCTMCYITAIWRRLAEAHILTAKWKRRIRKRWIWGSGSAGVRFSPVHKRGAFWAGYDETNCSCDERRTGQSSLLELSVSAGAFQPGLVAHCLDSQDCHLIPLYYILSYSSAESCYSFCLIFFYLLAHSPDFVSPENSSIFFVKRGIFVSSCLAGRRSKLVGGVCSNLSYGTGICCYSVKCCFKVFYYFCPFLSKNLLFFKDTF